MKILIVEDDFVSRKLLQRQLSKYGECSLASNGKQAVSLFAKAIGEGVPFDLMCLDIMMPIMDGHETLSMIRKTERRHGIDPDKRVNVLMTTALADHENIMQAMRNQCQGYLVKPIIEKQLVLKMKELNLIDSTDEDSDS